MSEDAEEMTLTEAGEQRPGWRGSSSDGNL